MTIKLSKPQASLLARVVCDKIEYIGAMRIDKVAANQLEKLGLLTVDKRYENAWKVVVTKEGVKRILGE